jgi:FkbM family methyltransferase
MGRGRDGRDREGAGPSPAHRRLGDLGLGSSLTSHAVLMRPAPPGSAGSPEPVRADLPGAVASDDSHGQLATPRYSDVTYYRRDTYDASILHSVEGEYASLPDSLTREDTVLDIGSHIGAFCRLAADRGARVVGYEANRENHALANLNLMHRESVSLHQAAVWRSDQPGSSLLFTPSAAPDNTGGGSVLFQSEDEHWQTIPLSTTVEIPAEMRLSTHAVPTVALDVVLREIGPVRFMKIDVEGAEFPILLTATELRNISVIAGEFHAFTEPQMKRLAPEALVGQEPYTGDLLCRHLNAVGFDAAVTATYKSRGLFEAYRRD